MTDFTTSTGSHSIGRRGLLEALQARLDPIRYSFTKMRATVVDVSPLTVQQADSVIPANGIRGLTYQPGDLVICLIDGHAGLPIALPLTRDF